MQPRRLLRSLKQRAAPAVLVPVTHSSPQQALEFINEAARQPFIDFLELRIDCLEGARDIEAVGTYVKKALAAMGDKGAIVTFRTAAEGGNCAIAEADYVALYQQLMAITTPHYVDVEANRGSAVVEQVMAAARAQQVGVIVSQHDFKRTATREVLIEQLEQLHRCAADVVKLAVMPHSNDDVLALLGATSTFKQRHPEQPLITMSMGPLGMLSRLVGEQFGSDATFGKLDNASAPGQIDADVLHQLVTQLHQLSND
ncbi:type I 3-dehydroquinate dehydratase [Carnimonas bestiolae]|uniref:type I 3-dehydroquinate dehydratase n=1 Tax=Carnimonas bestiolae TaxID=3402172 RepID=UPI003EDC15F1